MCFGLNTSSDSQEGAFGLPRFFYRAHCGFTIVELIFVVLLITITSVVIGPRFFGVSSYEVATTRAELISLFRFAQESALNISDTRDPADPTGAMLPVRVQVVFAPDPDPALSVIRVEAGRSNPGCAALASPSVLREIPMQRRLNYPAASRLQFNSLAGLDSDSTCALDLELDLDNNGVPELCVEPSGYAHEAEEDPVDSTVKCYHQFI